ncbi:alginate export family protein [Aestuariibacter sp. AA17]|uniref:Alginate export family protein n=1 Tax=Fluctibacter corallii TaxID=2984329 RepID=A0ABT3A602_9ALTE|nr:alginate export family protein [Aestuariibacter sp. AA17]MCV2884012.1 alginate export family protein [Aestuariibacter sp. AA17]
MAKLSLLATLSVVVMSAPCAANILNHIKTTSQLDADFRLRFESVEQDNVLDDAQALTFRSRIGFTASMSEHVYVGVEMEDTRIALGISDYSVGPTGFNPGQYSVIADPEHTELDQGYIGYKTQRANIKLGRQVIALDDHRFVGHVGWRQDRQTFDALRIDLNWSKTLSSTYAYISQRNRIFADDADLDSKDHILNISATLPSAKLTAFAYLLEVDSPIANGLDTYGVGYQAKPKVGETVLNVSLMYATQSTEGAIKYDANYWHASGSVMVGNVLTGIRYEVLGSDDGQYGFSTPLATLHKFNGWADQFLSTPNAGLEDVSVFASQKSKWGNWRLAYHQYKTEDNTSIADDDLGSEWNASYLYRINTQFKMGIKGAFYSGDNSRVDTNKWWVWLEAGL